MQRVGKQASRYTFQELFPAKTFFAQGLFSNLLKSAASIFQSATDIVTHS